MSIARQFGLNAIGRESVRRYGSDKPNPLLKTRVTAELEQAVAAIQKRGRGRPRKPESDKPWIAAGVSKASWYRRKAKT